MVTNDEIYGTAAWLAEKVAQYQFSNNEEGLKYLKLYKRLYDTVSTLLVIASNEYNRGYKDATTNNNEKLKNSETYKKNGSIYRF